MPSIAKTFELLDRFSKLPKGWNFGEGMPSSVTALRQSKIFLSLARELGLHDVEAFPGIDGEIQLCFYNENLTLEVTFEVDGTLTIVYEKDNEIIYTKQGVSFGETIKLLKDYKFKKCPFYESLTSAYTTVQGKNASQVWHLDPRQQTAVSLSSAENARRMSAIMSAATSVISTQELLEHQSSFGKSQTKKFLAFAASSKV